MNPAAIQPL